MRRSWWFAPTLIVVLATSGEAQATTVFRGLPTVKVTENGLSRTAETLPVEKGGSLQVVVSRIGDRYYWASRENAELVRVERGAFITFVALNGSGYIRFIAPDLKQAVSMMSETEKQYDYVENLNFGLRTITYFGTSRLDEG